VTDLLAPALRPAPIDAEDTRRRRPAPRKRRTRLIVAVVAVAMLAGEAMVGVSLWHAHTTRDRQRQQLTGLERRLNAVDALLRTRRAQLDAVRHDLTQRTNERDDASRALAQAERDLGTVRTGVAYAAVQATSNSAQITALSGCLGGAQQAVLRIQAGDVNGAVATLRSVQPACDSALTAAGGDGPVFPFDFADPFVLRVGSSYYAYSTNAGAGNVQVIRSTDLRHWELLGNALPNLPSWAAPNATWAPAVLARNGFYVLYYAAPDNPAGQRCIAAAVSFAPEGPYVDSAPGPIVCRTDLGGAIDPSPFVDAHGNAWLLWRTEGRPGQPGALWSAPLSSDGRTLAGDPAMLIQADQSWEQGVVEGPTMVPLGGGVGLFYSGSDWNSRRYATGFARCATPAGPCTKPVRAPVLASHGAVAGPGGGEIFTDANGSTWMAYHAFAKPNVGYPASRLLRLARVTFVNGLPVFAPPPW
jgi:Glycosyl hydrolases family 43